MEMRQQVKGYAVDPYERQSFASVHAHATMLRQQRVSVNFLPVVSESSHAMHAHAVTQLVMTADIATSRPVTSDVVHCT